MLSVSATETTKVSSESHGLAAHLQEQVQKCETLPIVQFKVIKKLKKVYVLFQMKCPRLKKCFAEQRERDESRTA